MRSAIRIQITTRMGRILAVLAVSLPLWSIQSVTAQDKKQPNTPTRRIPPRRVPTPAKAGADKQTEEKESQAKPALKPQSTRPERPSTQPATPPRPTPEETAEEAQPVGRDETGRVKIDPELQKRIDQMLLEDANRRTGDQGAGPTPQQGPENEPFKTPAQRAAERRRALRRGADAASPSLPVNPVDQESQTQPDNSDEVPGTENGPSTEIEIEPEPDVATSPPEQRRYGFSIKNGTYEQLIKGFARQTGMGVLGEAPRDGMVTFETTETLSFREALGRIRMLLFNYKPLEPYWILNEGTHLRVIRVTDLYRILPKSQMFRSVEDFRAANPPDDDIVLVIYTPKSGSIADLRQVRDFLPDYVRVTPLETGNSVSIFALVTDIKKYLELIDFFPTGSDDPRSIERLDVQFTTPTEAVNRLRMLADLDTGGRTVGPIPRSRSAQQPSPLDQMSDPNVSLIPDDAQGYFLVRAMQNKIEEIRKLMPYVDVEMPSNEFSPVVIPVEHAEATDLVTTIQQVLSASSMTGASPAAAPKPPRRGRRGVPSAGAASAPVAADSVTLIPHPSRNAIVVLGDEAGVAKVRDLVSLFDISSVIGPLRIQLEIADAAEVVTTVTQVLGVGVAKGQAAGGEQFQLVPDPSGSAIWYSGTEEDLVKVREVVAALDVAEASVSLRVVRLTYQLPSFVVGLLKEFDGSTSSSPAPAPGGRTPKSRRVVTQAPSKFTPDDVQKVLYILCTDSDWERYEVLIAQIDKPIPEREPFVRLEVQHVDPSTAVERLGAMLGNAGAVDSSIRTVATDDSILLIGATPTDVARIKVFLAEIDKPSMIEQRTFEILHADPADIKTAIETLLADGESNAPSAPRRRLPRGDGANNAPGLSAADASVSSEMTILQLGNRLVIKATPQRLDEIANLIAEFDVETTSTEMKVFADFPPGSDILGITETMLSAFGGGGRPAHRLAKDSPAGLAATGPRFIAQPASGRLVVIAEKSQFPEIEKLLDILRVEASAEPILVEFVDVKFVDPTDVAEEVKPLLDLKIRGLLESGELSDSAPDTPAPTSIPRPGRAKALQRTGGDERYHIAADARNERLVIAAPRAIVDEAKKLIEMFDQPAEKKDEVVFVTVDLANAAPADMVKAVKEMLGKSSAGRVSVQRGRPKISAGAAAESISTETLTVFEAPGGGAIVLNGVAADVEQAAEWIRKLDAMATRGRSIKLYEVKNANLAQVFDLIVNVVDKAEGPRVTGRPVRPPAFGPGSRDANEDEEEFATTKTHTGGDLYIQADLIGKTMLVATTQSKMAQIDDIVKMFETDEEIAKSVEEKFVPKFTYKLEFADQDDAKWDLRDLLEALWEPHGTLPQVDTFLTDSLVVRYPDATRFDEIKGYIRDHIDKPKEKQVKRTSFPAPEGMSAAATANWLRINMPGYKVELFDKTPEQKDFPTIEEVRPMQADKSPGVSPCVLPTAFGHMAQAMILSVTGQSEPPPDEPPDEEHQENAEPILDEQPIMDVPPLEPPDMSDAMIRQALESMLSQEAGEKGKKPDEKDGKPERGEKKKSNTGKALNVYIDDSQGVLVIEGEEADIDAVKDSMDQLKEEIKNYHVAPDIRILRVKYIDVYTAQDIIEEMFNATKSQQAMFNVQQQQQQQVARLRAMQAARLAQQQQGQGRNPQGQDGRGGAPGPQNQQAQAEQQQMQMPQLPAPAVRVYPNPRDRTLILRAETNQYPQIYELLATIDQPKPVDSVLRTYTLKKLNAVEVEQMLRESLHLDEAKARPKPTPSRFPGAQGAASAPTTGPGGQLPQTVLQESVTGSLLGVDPQDITMFSSETANTIMVMAPPAALDYIGKLIEQFESGDIAERITRYYELRHAQAAEVVEQLADYFSEKSPGRMGGGMRRGGSEPASSSTGGGLNAPSFIAYDRLNLLTVQATDEQFKEIEEIIARLDVKSEEEEWKDVVLAHADAQMVAETLTEMFGATGAASSSRGGTRGSMSRDGGSSARGGTGAKFIGEEGGRIVLYSAPKALNEQILATVAKLEEQSKKNTTPRIIELTNATPSQVADAIEKAYDTKRTGAKGVASGTPRFTVTAHDPTRRLFVVADDEMFTQIESLTKTLDTPGSGMAVEFRIYPLQYANAKAVHGQLTKLMTEYITRLGPKEADRLEAFSVQPDETANALVVLGTPSVFGFIEENLRKIDTPASAVTQQEVHVVEVKNADPDSLVKALTDIFVRTAQKGPDGDASISISAATGSKAILVRCNAVDFAKIDATIKELDTQEVATAGNVRVVTLQYGDASEVNAALQSYLKKPAGVGARGDQLIGDVRLGVLSQTNAIMVSGDAEQLDRIEGIIHGMDIAGEKGSVPQIIPLKFAGAGLILPSLKEMFSDPKMGGGQKSYAPPVIVADEMGNNIIVRGSPTDLAAIQGVIEKLDTEDKVGKSTVRIVQVAPGINVEDLAEKVEQSINESARLRTGAGAGRGSQVPAILAMPDKRTNSITLAGSTMLFDEAESMIRTLEKMGPSGNQVTAIIPVPNIATDDIKRLIEQMTEQSSGGSSRRGSSGGRESRPSRR